jgi:hypothetical protein
MQGHISYPNVVLCPGVVEFSQTPVDEAQFPVLMIDHNVMRLHISVHDALAVTVVERLEEFVDVVSHVQVIELGVESPEIRVVDILKDEGRCLALPTQIWLGNTAKRTDEGRRVTCESRTTSRSATMLGPPARFCRILISRLIFFFLTGLRTLMTHFW